MSWKSVLFTDVVKDVTSGNAKIKKGDYLKEGVLPVIDQGKKPIGGYIDDEKLACNVELPIVLSGYPVYSTEYHILWLTTYYLGARNRIACYSMLHQTVKKQATRL